MAHSTLLRRGARVRVRDARDLTREATHATLPSSDTCAASVVSASPRNTSTRWASAGKSRGSRRGDAGALTAGDAGPVRPDRGESLEAKLACSEAALVDLEIS